MAPRDARPLATPHPKTHDLMPDIHEESYRSSRDTKFYATTPTRPRRQPTPRPTHIPPSAIPPHLRASMNPSASMSSLGPQIPSQWKRNASGQVSRDHELVQGFIEEVPSNAGTSVLQNIELPPLPPSTTPPPAPAMNTRSLTPSVSVGPSRGGTPDVPTVPNSPQPLPHFQPRPPFLPRRSETTTSAFSLLGTPARVPAAPVMDRQAVRTQLGDLLSDPPPQLAASSGPARRTYSTSRQRRATSMLSRSVTPAASLMSSIQIPFTTSPPPMLPGEGFNSRKQSLSGPPPPFAPDVDVHARPEPRRRRPRNPYQTESSLPQPQFQPHPPVQFYPLPPVSQPYRDPTMFGSWTAAPLPQHAYSTYASGYTGYPNPQPSQSSYPFRYPGYSSQQSSVPVPIPIPVPIPQPGAYYPTQVPRPHDEFPPGYLPPGFLFSDSNSDTEDEDDDDEMYPTNTGYYHPPEDTHNTAPRRPARGRPSTPIPFRATSASASSAQAGPSGTHHHHEAGANVNVNVGAAVDASASANPGAPPEHVLPHMSTTHPQPPPVLRPGYQYQPPPVPEKPRRPRPVHGQPSSSGTGGQQQPAHVPPRAHSPTPMPGSRRHRERERERDTRDDEGRASARKEPAPARPTERRDAKGKGKGKEPPPPPPPPPPPQQQQQPQPQRDVAYVPPLGVPRFQSTPPRRPPVLTSRPTINVLPPADVAELLQTNLRNLDFMQGDIDGLGAYFGRHVHARAGHGHGVDPHAAMIGGLRAAVQRLSQLLRQRMALRPEQLRVGTERWHAKSMDRLLSLWRTIDSFGRFAHTISARGPSVNTLAKGLVKLGEFHTKLTNLAAKFEAMLNRLKVRELHSELSRAHAEASEQLRNARSKRDLPGWDDAKQHRAELRRRFIEMRNKLARYGRKASFNSR
ncbi:hypothetical protein H0H81_010464 [Sphagnurus paluster]|uniref:Uncharacterized protein n=1 Tax=Sphagnurus paluster TaxID=117069 RepID=A0A9P7GPV3_9AGAR|nr:hypothetical protein H0H81_010464 [Sphagnurus paluster]